MAVDFCSQWHKRCIEGTGPKECETPRGSLFPGRSSGGGCPRETLWFGMLVAGRWAGQAGRLFVIIPLALGLSVPQQQVQLRDRMLQPGSCCSFRFSSNSWQAFSSGSGDPAGVSQLTLYKEEEAWEKP